MNRSSSCINLAVVAFAVTSCGVAELPFPSQNEESTGGTHSAGGQSADGQGSGASTGGTKASGGVAGGSGSGPSGGRASQGEAGASTGGRESCFENDYPCGYEGATGPLEETHEPRITGLSPTEALQVTEVEVTSSDDGSDVRMSCGDTPVRDLYQPRTGDIREAARLLAASPEGEHELQLTGLPVPESTPFTEEDYLDIRRQRDGDTLRGYRFTDGNHGVNLSSGLKREGLNNYATAFPTGVAQGASFDFELVRRIGAAIGDESLASGHSLVLAPTMNLLRHPFWGRAQETFGEDTYHLGRMGTALTLGIQEYIGACAKHFLANNIEQERYAIDADMNEQTLREVYGRHFEMVVRDAGVACVMAAYNSVNGTKATINKHLLTDMLRVDMGFQGFVMSDWWALPAPHSGHGPAPAPTDELVAFGALRAGLDVEVPWNVNFGAIPHLMRESALGERLVVRSVGRVLRQKLRFNSAHLASPLGLKQPAAHYDGATGSIDAPSSHLELASLAAERGMVLLRNKPTASSASALPIREATSVAVLGRAVEFAVKSTEDIQTFDFARDAALGAWGSSRVVADPDESIGPLEGLQKAAPAGVEVFGGDSAADAKDADFVVVVVGLTPGDEGDESTGASDRATLALPNVHNHLIQNVIALGKPMAVVIEAGAAVDMPWLAEVPAVVMAWYPGQRGGEALGRLLFGKANFSGRLPVTWPQSEAQLPQFSEGTRTKMEFAVGYKRFDELMLFPRYAFGHGLSYSTFSYERVHIPCATIGAGGVIQIEVDVLNSNGPAGEEVVMVFASYPETTTTRPLKELKGFARVGLQPGQRKRVSIPIRVEDLKTWKLNRWAIEKGRVEFRVGPSSDKLLDPVSIMID